jgi:hypothetical protein
MAPDQLTDPPAELLLLDRRHRHGPALGVAVLAGQPAGPSLGDLESILHNHHDPAT